MSETAFRKPLPLEEEAPTTPATQLAKRIARYILRYKHILIIVVASTIATAIIGLLTPYLLATIIDEYITKLKTEGLTTIALLYLTLMIGQWISQTLRSYSIQTIGQYFLNNLRQEVFEKLQRLSLQFYTTRRIGDLISIAINDTTILNEVLVSGMLSIIGDIISLAGIIAIMIYLSPPLAAVALINIPLIALITRFFGSRLRRAYRLTRRKIAELTTIVEESIAGISVIKSFRKEEDIVYNFSGLSRETINAYLNVAKLMGFFWPLTNIATTLSTVLVLIIGAYLSITGLVTIGIVIAFIQYVNKLGQPITQLVNMYDSLQAAFAAAERIYGILDAEEYIKEDVDAIELNNILGEVKIKNLSFSYTKEEQVLKDINLHINPGETIALVGKTGAGKTTLANLICRFYDPDKGTIYIDGIDIRKISIKSLRRLISYVPQETYLFPGTIIDNIRLGRPDAADEEIINICKSLGIHEFIEKLPNGYNTDAGEAGKRLSTGEKQLISIARAMLRKPSIVILDEALSSVDTATEEIIKNAIKHLIKGRTSIIIAHRLTLARDADKIVVIDGGRIVEEGTYQQLIDKKGYYYKLLQKQTIETIAK